MILAVTVAVMLQDARYWPRPCTDSCELSGLGGIVEVWENWVDEHKNARFVVRGVCASACEIAYQRAKKYGTVKIAPKAKLIKHRASPAKWR